MTTTPEKLRAGAKSGEWIPVPAADGEMLADAMEIADASARSDIESFCAWTSPHREQRFYDTGKVPTNDEDRASVDQAVRYLEARGLLEHHPRGAMLVRFKAV